MVIALKRHGLLVAACLMVGASAVVSAAAPSTAVLDTSSTSHCVAAGVGAHPYENIGNKDFAWSLVR